MTPEPVGPDHAGLGKEYFNGVWTLLETENRTPAEDDRMLHMAHASRHHWGEVGAVPNLVRGEWQCSRVYAVLRRAEPARHHAERSLAICTDAGVGDWDLAFCHEALARAHALAGDLTAARASVEHALAVPIADDEDRGLLLGDLESIPGLERFW